MAAQEIRSQFRLARRAGKLGVPALVAATIGGYTLYQHSAVTAQAVEPPAAGESTPEATAEGLYQDGQYTGDSVQAARWGNVQVTVIIENGQIADFQINDYPHTRSMSDRISQVAIPYLMQEAIQAQSASIDIVSGATPTSEAFIQSLQSALEQAATGATPSPSQTPAGISL
jgi:uncharacterized protein with FMN-binding domain